LEGCFVTGLQRMQQDALVLVGYVRRRQIGVGQGAHTLARIPQPFAVGPAHGSILVEGTGLIRMYTRPAECPAGRVVLLRPADGAWVSIAGGGGRCEDLEDRGNGDDAET